MSSPSGDSGNSPSVERPIDTPAPEVLLAGLGNPTPQYAGTRHNLGREIVGLCARRLHCELRRTKSLSGSLGVCEWQSRRVHLFLPQIWMNESGRAIRSAMQHLRFTPSQILIICDDVALPVGALRLRQWGSSGGHRGLKSVEGALGTQSYPRLRVGIGDPPEGMELEHFVLARFTGAERATLADVEERAAKGALMWATGDAHGAMNEINGASSPKSRESTSDRRRDQTNH